MVIPFSSIAATGNEQSIGAIPFSKVSSAALVSLQQNPERLYPRKPTQTMPVPGKIYFLPDGRHFRNSVIHNQKQQEGFFQHPVLVVGADGEVVQFYAMTKEPPRAIRDLNMALRIGATHEDEGFNILRLASDLDIMLQQTWVNLEQRFFIEWRNLDEWTVPVRVHRDNFYKITRRVFELEADQNRFIYKPLLRDMSIIQPGTVIMMPNAPNSSTLGAPIVVIENNYPNFCFLRVKRFEDNVHFNPESRRRSGSSRARSLAISKVPSTGHDGTPVLFLDEDSPEMRGKSYVELEIFKYGRLDQCRTWCWPPVKISSVSMALLHSYTASVAVRNRRPVYYTPHVGCLHGTYGTIPPPRYYMNQPQIRASLPSRQLYASLYPSFLTISERLDGIERYVRSLALLDTTDDIQATAYYLILTVSCGHESEKNGDI
jgi:hypothetical protein